MTKHSILINKKLYDSGDMSFEIPYSEIFGKEHEEFASASVSQILKFNPNVELKNHNDNEYSLTFSSEQYLNACNSQL